MKRTPPIPKLNAKQARPVAIGCLIFVCLFLLIPGIGFIRPVDQGEVCAVTRFGKYSRSAEAGLNFRFPLVDGYHCFSTRDVVYETSDEVEASQADYRDTAVTAQTSDGQQIRVKYSVLYHVTKDNVKFVYENTGRDMPEVNERSVKFNSRSEVRLEVQNYTAALLYSGNIRTVQQTLENNLREQLAIQGVTLTAFRLRKIEFDENYISAIEQQQIALINIEKAEYDSQAAVFEAQSNLELAKGQAQSNIELANAEAEAIRVQGAALREYPEVLQLEFIQKAGISWGILPFESVQPFLPLSPFGATQTEP